MSLTNWCQILLVLKDGHPGESAERVKRAADQAGVAYLDATDVADATRKAFEFAEPGDIVLLSPANARWDMYANFEYGAMTSSLKQRRVGEKLIWKK